MIVSSIQSDISETGSRMKDCIVYLSDNYNEVLSLLLSSLENVPSDKEGKAALAATIYKPIILSGQWVDEVKTITQTVIGRDGTSLLMNESNSLVRMHTAVKGSVQKLPALALRGKMEMVVEMGELIEPVGNVVVLLESMEKIRFNNSKMKRH